MLSVSKTESLRYSWCAPFLFRLDSRLTLYQPMTHICVMGVLHFFHKAIRIYNMGGLILDADTLYVDICFLKPFFHT